MIKKIMTLFGLELLSSTTPIKCIPAERSIQEYKTTDSVVLYSC